MKKLYRDCLFVEFYKRYGKIFALPKPDIVDIKVDPDTKEPIEIERKHMRYTWGDEIYSTLMMDLSKKLEPAYYEAKTVLFDELDEFTEIIFPMEGYHLVGFSINK